ncbi:MAG: hypothetical protein ACM30E_10105 [Nitrososphaerales archaeon]
MKHWSKLAVALAVFALLLGVFAVASAEPGAAPTKQTATATPAPKPTVKVDTANPTVPYVKDWQGSGHADATAMAFRDWDETDPQAVPVTCAKCHSSAGYQDFLGADGSAPGKVDKPAPVNTVIDCVACHNPATIAKTSVTFPSGITLTGLGDESRCMECHQGRESVFSVNKQITDTFKLDPVKDLDTVVKPIVTTTNGKPTTTTFGFRNVHYFAAAATQYGTLVKGGYEYDGQTYDGKFQHPAPFNTCIGCHNQHTLQLKIDQCGTCHAGVKTVEDLSKIRMNGSLVDYNGNGDVKEGIQKEYAGVQAMLYDAIKAYAKEVAKADIVYDAGAYPYFYADKNANGKVDEGETPYASWTPRLLKAAYNYQVAGKDPGAFAHNAKYVIQLMHDSIADLNTKIAKPIDLAKAARNDVGHFDGTAMAFRDWDAEGEVPAQCAKCHSSTGLPEFIHNGGTVAVTSNGQIQTVGTTAAEPANGFECSTCHNDLAKYTVYPVTSVPMPSGKTVTFSTEKDAKGNLTPVAANLCLECHQGRASTQAVNLRLGDADADKVPEKGLGFINVHYFAAGASLFGNDAQGAYQYADKQYSGRHMHPAPFDTCTGCHNTHELGIQMDKCVTCHAGIKEPGEIRMTAADLDGDKDVKEGAAEEVVGLQEKLLAAIQDYAKNVAKAAIVYDAAAYPYFFEDTNGNGKVDTDEKAYAKFTPRLLKAAYNYQYSQKDPGIFAHNLAYAGQILYDSMEDLKAGGAKVDLTGLTRPAAK